MNTNLKIRRTIQTLLLSTTIILFQQCTIKENVAEARLDQTVVNSQAALEATVAGLYRKFTLSQQWSQCWVRSYGGDDVTTHSASNKIGFRDSDKMVMSSITAGLDLAYSPFYATIKEANNIIANKDKITSGNTQAINYMIGEAYFLRAYSYFHLTRVFGRIPVIISTDIVGNTNLKKSEILDVYKQIETDFQEAEKLLPAKYPGVSSAVRPNIGSAKGLLAKLYLHWAGWPLKDASKYALAAEKAKEVIDNASTYGFALVPDTKTLWSILDQNRFNTETVFGLAHQAGLSGTYSNRHVGRVGYPVGEGINGWEENFAEIKFFNDFPTGPRKEATYRTEVVINGKTVKWDTLRNERHPMFLKVTGFQNEIATTNSTTSMTTYCMRYADLLLIYAEAEGRSGSNSAGAWEALNKVRRRAYGYPINTAGSPVDLTSGNLAELAYTERKWELAGEFQRWDDLTRMERVAEALAGRSSEEPVGPVTGDTSPANYFAPIPQSEIEKAPQLAE